MENIEKRMFQLTNDLFNNDPRGKELLAIWEEYYLKQPCWIPGNDHSYGYLREGENKMIRNIIASIHNHKVITEVKND